MDDTVFLDTSFLIAFVNDDDAHHKKARQQMKEMDDMVITNSVFSETMNTMFSRNAHRKAVEFSKYLRKSQIHTVNMPEPILDRTFEKFSEHEISFTDCSIVAAMEMLGVEKLATFDTDFERFEKIEKIPKEE